MNPTVQLLLAASLAFTMLTIALGLKAGDFGFVRRNPASVLIGMAAQLIGLPLMTLGLVWWLMPDTGIALGMIIIACCPGGNMSNLLTRIGHGDTAYSVALTMLSSIFAAALLPLTILFWTGLYPPTANLLDEININRVDFILTTSVTLALPLALGLWLSHSKPLLAEQLNSRFMPVSVGILVLVIVAGLLGNLDLLRTYSLDLMPLVITHNGLAFLLGSLAGLLFLKSRAQTRALTFEVGIQNAGLGLLVVLAHLKGISSAAVIIGAWGVWHLIAGFLLANLFRLADTFQRK